MKAKDLALELYEKLGKKENIISNAVCMTRLRVKLKNAVDLEQIKNVKGVLSVIEQDTLQIVLGPGVVNTVGEEFAKLTGLPLNSIDVQAVAKENKTTNKEKHDGPVQRFLQKIANIFIPLLPGIIAAGLILGLTNVINVSTGGVYANLWWFRVIKSIGFVMFGYLAIFVGMNSSKEFGGTPILGAVIGGLFIANNSLPLLSKDILLPITNAPFKPGFGGLLAALFMGIIVAKLEKAIRKIVPTMLDTFFTPLLTLIIAAFVAVLIIQPVGTYVTNSIFILLDFVYNKLGFVGGYLLAAGFLPLVSVGLHQALTPIHVLLNTPDGPTHGINYLLPILMMAGGGQVGAGFAIYLKTKSKKLKQLTRDALPIGILGIGEPLMYAVTLPLGKPFITACLGSGFGGLVAALLHVGTVTQGVSGLFGLLIVVKGTWLYFVLAMVSAYIGGFVLTYLFGVDDDRIREIYGE